MFYFSIKKEIEYSNFNLQVVETGNICISGAYVDLTSAPSAIKVEVRTKYFCYYDSSLFIIAIEFT